MVCFNSYQRGNQAILHSGVARLLLFSSSASPFLEIMHSKNINSEMKKGFICLVVDQSQTYSCIQRFQRGETCDTN